ncbi:MAG TPA: hypothetical protein VGM82_00235 [Gemmatimonadaceae bacterium]|jgi:hypothetical protein
MTSPNAIGQFAQDLQKTYSDALKKYRASPGIRGVDIGETSNGIHVRVHWANSTDVIADVWNPQVTAPSDVESDQIVTIIADYRRDIERWSIWRRVLHVFDFLLPTSDPIGVRLPLRPGISVGGEGISGGTLGMIVFDSAGRAYILSAAHVLSVRPSTKEPIGENPTTQPARNGDNTVVIVGKEAKTVFDDGRIDAAISAIRDQLADGQAITYCRRTLSDTPAKSAVIGPPGAAVIGRPVRKSGNASLVTTGKIDGIGHYFADDDDHIGFDGFRITSTDGNKPSRRGDSGAIWYSTENSQGIGLHVAGDDTNASLACHLDVVFTELGVTATPPVPPPKHLIDC